MVRPVTKVTSKLQNTLPKRIATQHGTAPVTRPRLAEMRAAPERAVRMGA